MEARMEMNQQTAREWITLQNDRRPKVRYWLPAAAVDEEDLRRELRALSERGFGGVEIVVLNTTPPVIAKSADGWGHPPGTVRWRSSQRRRRHSG